MILPVSNLQPKNSIKQNSEQKNKIDYMSQSDNSNKTSDRFNKSQSEIAFKGNLDFDSDVKKYMNDSSYWRSTLYDKALRYFKQHNFDPLGVGGDLSDYINECESPMKKGLIRFATAVGTLGVSEVYNLVEHLGEDSCEKQASDYVSRVADKIQQIKNEEQLKANEARQAELAATRRRIAREAKEAEEANEKALAKTEYLNKLSEKQNELKTELCDKVNLERNGSHIEKMPNTIMIEDPYDDVSKELVDYAKRNSQSRFIRLDSSDNDTLMDNLDETLKKSKSHFDSTKERTLIHVEGFDRLITKGKNSFENIESLKDVMCRTAKDFGSTIIFRTKDASKLVSEAIGSQRVPVKILTYFKSVR